MNPLKWSVRMRLAVVASVLWEMFLFSGYGQDSYADDPLFWSIPVALCWGGAWITHGIRHKKATKE